jgi:F-box interacting protein
MSECLPAAVVVRILSRLPPKSLIRFKCVSKSWHALIGNPDFLSINLLNQSILPQNAGDGDPLRLILFHARDKSHWETLIHSFRSYDSLQYCASQAPLTLPPPPGPSYTIVALCNGLVCVRDYRRSDIYLWNPATSSEPKALLKAGSSPFLLGYARTMELVGFGFDSGSNDFKVVRLVDQYQYGFYEAEIYSLRRGSWRLLDVSVPLEIVFISMSAALDGVFLWYDEEVCDKHKHVSETIIAFDFSNEEIRTMLFPDARFFCDYGEYTRTVTELNGSIAMLAFPKEKKEMYLDIWVMLEFGVTESWTRLLSIGLPLHLERPLRFWKKGELFMENSEGQLVLYDLFTQTETNLQFEGYEGTLTVVDYELSSVLINGEKDNP